MIEQELKTLISGITYYIALGLFDWNPPIIQANYYYTDREGILGKHKISVRVRSLGKNNYLQIKIPVRENNALHIKDEYEQKIDNVPACIDGKLLESITGIKINSAAQVGQLITERHVFNYNKQIEVCLDKNEYLNTIDYEMEIEFIDKVDNELFDKLSSIGIHFYTKTDGKFSRFIKRHKLICNI